MLDDFIRRRKPQIAKDKDNRIVFLTETRWSLEREINEHPDITFHTRCRNSINSLMFY